ncbi:MAG: metallophosphoesterase [Ruminococcus flavefaciens]|nr:metallophosphoesterase [Ruminococcus flavefaciens]
MHISDIHKSHKGLHNCRISGMAEKECPDLIFITGDLVSRTETDFSSAQILLEQLCRVAPVYIIQGNHEQSLPSVQQAQFFDMLGKSHARLLVNQGEYIRLKGRKIWVGGVQQKYSTYKKNDSYRNLDVFTDEDMNNALGNAPECLTLLLAHNPLWAEVYSRWGADYTFSGHVHGGVVRIFGKGILSPERKLFPRYSKGIYNVGRMKLCVSGGVGKLRMFNPPEIVIYTI